MGDRGAGDRARPAPCRRRHRRDASCWPSSTSAPAIRERAEAAIVKAAIAEARAAGEPCAELRGLYNLASLHYGQGRLTESIEVFRAGRGQRPTRSAGSGRRTAWTRSVFGAIAAHVSGDWDARRAA